jgi:hypothetical protein
MRKATRIIPLYPLLENDSSKKRLYDIGVAMDLTIYLHL